MALTIFVLLSIGSVCATDADDTSVSSEDDSQIGLSQGNVITDNLKSSGEDTPLTQIENDDETLTVEDTPNALGGTEGNYSNLRDEIGNGGNINLSRSNYIYVSGDGDTIVITSPGVIDGKGAVIDMAGAYIQAFVVSADNVTIKNLTIQNVNTYGEGGAFYVNGSSNVTITNCKFINNNAQDGGAIYFNAANVIVSDCIFNNNSAFFNGGAIFINCTNFTATKCIFTNNNATGYGGNCGEGGAISVYGRILTYIDNCEFTNNTATPGDPKITDMWMSSAGAIDGDGETVITNSRFNNNYASMGGAICFTFGDLSRISNCNFTNNSALYAGAFENLDSINVTVEYSTFDSNNALYSSGAIDNDCESILSVIGCIFTGNKANDAYAIYNDLEGDEIGQLTVVNSTFAGNGGDHARSIYNDGTLTLAGNNVDNVIYNNGTIASTANVIVLANKTVDAKCGETVKLNATLTDDNGNLIEDENLNFTVDGVVVKSSYASGIYTANYTPDKVGQKVVSAILDYDATVKTGTIIVNIVETKLSANAVTTTYNVAKNLVVTLKDAYGNPVSNAKITIKFNGRSTPVTTDKNGQAKLAINLPVNTYTATITYDGDDSHVKSATTAKVVVKKASPKIVANKKTFKVKTKTKKYTITLKDNKGKAIKKAKVTLKVKGKTYKATTNSKGKATFKLTKLNKNGKYKATIKYTGNKNFKAVTKTIKYITVKK